MRRPVSLAFALSILALLFAWKTRQAYNEVPHGQDNVLPAAPGRWQPGAPIAEPAPAADTNPTVAAISARPLFRPDRQPFREQGSASARNYEAELSRFTLLGVVDFGNGPKGLVVSRSGNRTDRWEVKAGDSLPGFKVMEVRTDSLVLSADGKEFPLPLYAGSPTAAGAALRTETGRPPASSTSPPAGKASAPPGQAQQQPQPATQGRQAPFVSPAPPAPAARPIPGRRFIPGYNPPRP